MTNEKDITLEEINEIITAEMAIAMLMRGVNLTKENKIKVLENILKYYK